jgi:hypothetical protein
MEKVLEDVADHLSATTLRTGRAWRPRVSPTGTVTPQSRRASYLKERAVPSQSFSTDLATRDHAHLAEQLADNIDQLRQSRILLADPYPARNRLDAFLVEGLVPYLRAEDRALYTGGSGSGLSPGRVARRLREHALLTGAIDGVSGARTPWLALLGGRRVQDLLDDHLAHEDNDLLVDLHRAETGSAVGLTAALAAELDGVLKHEHVRIGKAIALAAHRDVWDEAWQQLAVWDRAIAALSQHAVVLSATIYPLARRRLPVPESTPTRGLTDDLRRATRAARHLNMLARGAAGEDPRQQNWLWEVAEQAWQAHVAEEELMVHRLAPLLRPARLVSLLTSLRSSRGRSVTRPHPMLLHGGWITRAAIAAQHRVDRWRDVLDNRDE